MSFFVAAGSKSPATTSEQLFGHVPGREEVLHVLDARGDQVLVRPDHREVVRVALGVHEPVDLELGHAVGLVLVRLAPLVAHDLALEVELLLVHRVAEVLEAVGLEPEQRREEVRRAPAEVVRPVGSSSWRCSRRRPSP